MLRLRQIILSAHEFTSPSGQKLNAFGFIFLCILGSMVEMAGAEDSKPLDYVTLRHSAVVSFLPEEAFFVLNFTDEKPKKLRAVFVPAFEDEQEQKAGKIWHFGVGAVPTEEADHVTFTIVVRGAGHYLLLPPVKSDLASERVVPHSVEQLRTELLKRKQALSDLEAQLSAQQGHLERLRADAEVIGDLGRIIEGNEAGQTVDTDITALKRESEDLEHFLSNLDSIRPADFAYRKRVLTGAISELVQKAYQVEAGEEARRHRAEALRRRYRGLGAGITIEDARELKRKLARLQAHRVALEEELGIVQEEDLSDYEIW